MKSIWWKGLLLAAAVVALSSTPASAGAFAVYGTWWNTSDAGDAGGVGLSYAWDMGDRFSLDLRSAWYEELTDEPLEDLVNGATPIESGLTVIPVEAVLRFNFAKNSTFWKPWFGVGVAYYALDTDSGNIDDEVGYLADFGATFGDGQGADFYAEVGYRFAKATVTNFDVNADNVLDEFDVKLDGPYASVGICWRW